MHLHSDLTSSELSRLIRRRELSAAGNVALKIYGTLHCKSGRRMKRRNRVFFADEKEARTLRFRPCGHCLREQYLKWKTNAT
jgi:methylphosphotriester-DNA--protein-cysteine methyltransferase